MIEMSFKEDLRDLQKHLNRYQKQALPQATNWALNETGKKVQSQITKEVAEEAGVKQKALKPPRFFATAKSSLKTLTFVISIRFGAIPLKEFNAVQTKKGVRAKAWNKSKTYKGAFIVDSIGKNVFKRRTKARLPIDKLHGPRPVNYATDPGTLQRAQEKVAAFFPDRLAMGIKRFERLLRKKAGVL